jgi:hypothetical protein
MPRHSSTNIAIATAHDLTRSLLSPPLLAPAFHLRQPAAPTTPTQQHLPPTHIATQQHTHPTATPDDKTITFTTTRFLFPRSSINHLSLSTPFTKQPNHHPRIIF